MPFRRRGCGSGPRGNQTSRAEAILRALEFDVDVIGTSDGWGVEKPSPGFFACVVAEAGCAAEDVLYVGDRLDNDIRPAQEAGVQSALVRRGPWGYVLDQPAIAGRCLFQLTSLDELPDLVQSHNGTRRR